ADVEDAGLAAGVAAAVQTPGQVQRRPSNDRPPLGQVVLVTQLVEVVVHRLTSPPTPAQRPGGEAAAHAEHLTTCTGYALAYASLGLRRPCRSRICSSSGRSSSAPWMNRTLLPGTSPHWTGISA